MLVFQFSPRNIADKFTARQLVDYIDKSMLKNIQTGDHGFRIQTGYFSDALNMIHAIMITKAGENGEVAIRLMSKKSAVNFSLNTSPTFP